MKEREYVVHEEETPWPWWAAAIVGVCVVAALWLGIREVVRGAAAGRPELWVPGLVAAGVGVGIGLLFRTLFGRMRTVVTRTSIRLTYGYTNLFQKLFTFDQIESVEPVRYPPLREFGGWGLRFGAGGKRAWTVRGDGAVVLHLDDGTRFYVGSDDPNRLAERIRTAMDQARKRGSGPGTGPTSEPTSEPT